MKTIDSKPIYTLITGSSTGLGKEFAIEFAKRHNNLILVALPGRNLHLLCNELENIYGIKAAGYECDLTNEKELARFVTSVLEKFNINTLVNNAGIGGTRKFTDVSTEYLDRIIHLNIRATTMLTHHLLPKLLAHKKALIINIASMAAFGPIPYKTIYPASKAFIYSFSRSLNKELQGTGVRVVVVNPGQIVTNPDVTLRLITQGFLGKLGLLSAGRIARIAIENAEKGKDIIIPGLLNKLSRMLIRMIPECIRLNLLEKAYRKELTLYNTHN
jgi:short-subunit dehydrogenase